MISAAQQLAITQISQPKAPDFEDGDLRQAAEQFESLFMHMMLKSMRQASRSLSEGNYFSSFETETYEDMMDEKLSVQMTASRSLGIADLLMNQFSPRTNTPNYELKMGGIATKQAGFIDEKEFVSALLPRAEPFADSLGVNPKFLVAQAALETGWGQHIMFDSKGKNSHNLFGIKANADWNGPTVAVDSLEVRQGVASQEKSIFKVYDSYEQSLKDYARLILDNNRYREVPNSRRIEEFGSALQQAGYATDPEYSEKLSRVMGNPSLKNDRYTLGAM